MSRGERAVSRGGGTGKGKMLRRIKKTAKKFIDYTIEDDIRIYRLRHTPFRLKISLTKAFLAEYGALPVQADKIVIDNYMGQGYGCNPKYVAECLLRRSGRCELVWAVRDVAGKRDCFPEGIRLVEYGTRAALREYATAGVWLCNYHLIAYLNRGLVKKPGQTYIQMWHGSFGIKKIENDCAILTENKSWTYLAKKNAGITDYWISNSGFETAVYRSAFWGAGEILEYGHPRNDIFFREDTGEIRRRVSRALGLSDEESVFLYVPTFRERGVSSAAQFHPKAVREALRGRMRAGGAFVEGNKNGENWRIVVRFHPRMDAAEREALLAKWEGVIDATAYPDIQELLVRADAAMTDYSSCLFDFLLSGRPGFLYVPDRGGYDEERGFYYGLEESPFPVAETERELLDNILMFDREAYKNRVERFLQERESKEDGRAAERTADLVIRVTEGKRI